MKKLLRVTLIAWFADGTRLFWALYNKDDNMQLMDHGSWLEKRQLTIDEIPDYVAGKRSPDEVADIEVEFGWNTVNAK